MHLQQVSPDGVGHVVEHGAHAAHVLDDVAVVDAGGAGQRGLVCAAHERVGLALHLDVAVLAPELAPGVADLGVEGKSISDI